MAIHFLLQFLQKLRPLITAEFALQLLQGQGHDVVVVCAREFRILSHI